MGPNRFLPLLLFAAGCGAAGAAGPVVRDSAGITIVENAAPSDAVYRIVDSVPLVDVGGSDDPNQELVRITDIVRLTDGTIVAADGGARNLRVFSADGRWIRTIGRQGGGPGEFQRLSGLELLSGDTIAAFDFQHRRLAFFTPDGGLAREVTLTADVGGLPILVGRFPDGRLLIRTGLAFGGGVQAAGLVRDTANLIVLNADGAAADTLGRFPGSESLVKTGGTGDRRFIEVRSLPLGKSSVFVVAGPRLVAATTDEYDVRLYRADSGLERIVRRAHTPRPVTEADIERYIGTVTGVNAKQEQEALRRFVREAPMPSAMPAHGRIVPGPDETLWVQEYAAPGEDGPTRYSVFDSTGRWLGDVTMPARFTPFVITGALVVGRWRDPDDVEHLRVYRLAAPR